MQTDSYCNLIASPDLVWTWFWNHLRAPKKIRILEDTSDVENWCELIHVIKLLCFVASLHNSVKLKGWELGARRTARWTKKHCWYRLTYCINIVSRFFPTKKQKTCWSFLNYLAFLGQRNPCLSVFLEEVVFIDGILPTCMRYPRLRCSRISHLLLHLRVPPWLFSSILATKNQMTFLFFGTSQPIFQTAYETWSYLITFMFSI